MRQLQQAIRLSLLSLILTAALLPTLAKADSVSLDTVLSKVTLNQGVMYGIKANSVQYTMTTDLVEGKGWLAGFNIIGGYSTAAKVVGGIDYDLMNLKSVNIPLLKYFDIHLGYLASWDNIGGRNVIDHGPVLTLISLSF